MRLSNKCLNGIPSMASIILSSSILIVILLQLNSILVEFRSRRNFELEGDFFSYSFYVVLDNLQNNRHVLFWIICKKSVAYRY
jgi:hypothetical protein